LATIIFITEMFGRKKNFALLRGSG